MKAGSKYLSTMSWAREKWRKLDVIGRYHGALRVDSFSRGRKPVIRWIKGNGLDDEVTAIALRQATRIFGSNVDYCLLTQGISAERARKVLAQSSQPVHWREVLARDNRVLAKHLFDAACSAENFGYWWKWFPERVRPKAPEWILDGDMSSLEFQPGFKNGPMEKMQLE